MGVLAPSSLVIPDVREETRWPPIMQLLQQNSVISSCFFR